MRTRNPILFGIILFLLVPSCLLGLCRAESRRVTSVVKVVRELAPMVVNIKTEAVVDLKRLPEWGRYGEALDEYFKQNYRDEYAEGVLKHKSLGSGVILGKSGHIVTNAHVVQRAQTIYVVLSDGTTLEAKLVRLSQPDDLAVIRADLPKTLGTVKLAKYEDMMIGETVIAIGNPYGLENTVTVGVLSGKNRVFSSKVCPYACSGLIQTDAPINPGNSGGPLFNLDGELVGINLVVAENAQSIGFAIPAYKIADLLKDEK
jgi:serine protease Do